MADSRRRSPFPTSSGPPSKRPSQPELAVAHRETQLGGTAPKPDQSRSQSRVPPAPPDARSALRAKAQSQQPSRLFPDTRLQRFAPESIAAPENAAQAAVPTDPLRGIPPHGAGTEVVTVKPGLRLM